MADTDKQVSYTVAAEASPFEAGMQHAADSARGAAGSIESSFRKVQDAFSEVQKQLTVLAGVVAGGTFFKAAISASMELTGETVKLSKALGINAEEAGTLRTALEDIGSSGDDYVDTFTKFARQLKSNEQGLKDLGLQTRDANGNLRDSNELYNEALRSVGQYKAGIDQNTYAQTVFGKSIDDVMKLQKLNNQVLEDARQKNAALGLTITQDNVEASKKYRLAMNDVGDVLTAVKKVIGDAVMPVFTELGEYFAGSGPYVVEVFKGAMMGLLTVFEIVRAAVKTIAAVVFEAFNLILDTAGTVGEVFSKLFSGDFSGAYEAAKKVGQRAAQAFSGAFDAFVEAGNDIPGAVQKHAERIYGSGGGTPDIPKGGTKRMGEFKNGKDQSQMSGWEAQLAEQKLAYQEQNNQAGTFYQFSKQQELQFWKDKLALTEAGSADNIAVRRKAAELELAINTDKFNHEQAALQAQEAGYKQNMAARLALLQQEATLVAQRYRQESKEYEDVQKRIIETKRQAVEQQKQIDAMRIDSVRDALLAQIDLEQQHAQLQLDMGDITKQQLLVKEQQFEDRRYQISMQALTDRLEILKNDPDRNAVALEQLHTQIEQAERQHQARMTQIRNQAALEASAASRRVYDSMVTDMQRSLGQMIQGQLTFRGFMQSVWNSLRNSVADVLAQMVIDFIKNSVIMAGVKRALAVFDIGTNAAQAGAGAAASAADTPVVGWILAPLAAAATFAMAAGYSGNVPSFSAAQGFDIPGTINPLVQTHANEMILPAKYADVIRRMSEQQPTSTPAPREVHLHVHAVDSKDVTRMLMDNNGAVMAAVRKAVRDFR